MTNKKTIPKLEEYDPYKHRQLEHPNGFLGALMHLMKSSMGTGILAMPSAIANAGLLVGVIATPLTGLLCAHTVWLLVSASQKMCKRAKVPMLGFSETAHAVCQFGHKRLQPFASFAGLFVDVALLLTYFTGNAVYVVFICTSIQKMVDYHYPNVENWSIQCYMLILLLPLIMSYQIRELKHLVPYSIIANTTMIVAFSIALYYIFCDLDNVDIIERKLSNDISLFPSFFSTAIFAMEAIGIILPVENSMLKPQFLGCCGVLNIGMIFIVTLYTIIGFSGYLKYGDKVSANVIEELPDEHVAAQVAKMCIAVAIFFTSMLQFYIPCDITWRKLSPFIAQEYHNTTQIVLRTTLAILITGIAAAVPKLDLIILLVGSVFFSTLGLFIPAVINIILNLGDDGDFGFMKWRLVKNLMIIFLSLLALTSGSYSAIKGLIKD